MRALQRLRERNAFLERELQSLKSQPNVEQSHSLCEVIDATASAIGIDSGLKSIYAAALTGLQRGLGIERASILLFDPDGVMRFKAWVGISAGYRKAVEGHTPWPQGTRDPQPVIVEDTRKDPSLASLILTFARENIRALAFIPLTYRGKLLGKFMLYSSEPYRFEKELEFALTLGKLIAFGIVRSQTEEELRASEELFRATFELSSIGKALVSADDRLFIRVNAKFSEMTGYSPEELNSMTFEDLTHPEDRKESEAALQNLISGLSSYDFDRRYVRKDGSSIWVFVSLAPIRDRSGKITSLIAAVQDITEKKQVEARLRDSEERFRGIFEQSPFSIQLLTAEGRTFAVNPAWKHLWRIPQDVFDTYIMTEYNVRRDPQLIEKGVMPQLENAFQGEFSVLPAILYDPVLSGAQGIPRWVEGYAYPVKDRKGRIREVVLMHNDITDRKRAEDQLRQSEAQFRQIVETAEEGVWVVDRNAKTTLVNKKMAQILGYSPDEMIGRDLLYFMDEESRKITEINLERRRRGIREHHEFKLLNKEGADVWTLMATSPIYDARGRYDGALAMVTDVTARRRATEELKELTERLHTLASSISDYIWSATFDQDGNFTYKYYSPVVERITGRPPDYYMSGPNQWLSTVHGDDRRRVEVALQRILNRQSDHEEADYRIIRPDGSVRWVRDSATVSLLRTGGIRIDGVVGDITERKLYLESRERLLAQETRARMEAERAIELRDDFLSIAAHELRTPLTPLRVYFQLIKQQIEALHLEPGQVALLNKSIKGTEREFDRFLKLVENLLDVTRISAGRIVLDRREFDLSELVRTVTNRFEAELKKAKCELRLNVRDQVVGRWDQSRIEQVMTNLLINAMKYGAKKPIEVSVSKTEAKALIVVKDHGIGISKEDQGKLFHRFERVAPIQHFAGFGLGLFISREIAEAHGGIIRLASEPGQGSTFTVELPLEGYPNLSS